MLEIRSDHSFWTNTPILFSDITTCYLGATVVSISFAPFYSPAVNQDKLKMAAAKWLLGWEL